MVETPGGKDGQYVLLLSLKKLTSLFKSLLLLHFYGKLNLKPVVNDVHVRVIPPGFHGVVVPLPSKLEALEPCSVLLRCVELLRSNGRTLQVDNVVVSVVTDLDVLEAQLGQDLVPGFPGDECGGVHDPTVCDDEAVLGALLGHREVGLLKGHHGGHQVLLEVQHLIDYPI